MKMITRMFSTAIIIADAKLFPHGTVPCCTVTNNTVNKEPTSLKQQHSLQNQFSSPGSVAESRKYLHSVSNND
ncbi:Urease subunit alpha [Frankliniella fusca]|uniref:Urease subunit alpha n=1 Tax=Frankliniella fusca TaxID=407009 RepID=A0AAE1I480_9NEOP|nr:Urease subunit alpha [Frankliniella fusca]